MNESLKNMTDSLRTRSRSAEKKYNQATFGKEDVSLFHKQNFDESEDAEIYPSSPRLQGALKEIERKVMEISQGSKSSNLQDDLNNIERKVWHVSQDVTLSEAKN